MSALYHAPKPMSENEYLAFERGSEIKDEYLTGEVNSRAGASREHNLICTNLVAALHPQLRAKSCEVYQSDMRLNVMATGLYAYPDVSIVCGEPQFVDDEFDTLVNPTVLIEVLSPCTEHFDRGTKFKDYRHIPSLQEYLLVSQFNPHIERYIRQPDDTWLLMDVVGVESKLELPSIDCELSLADVYERIVFEGDQ